MNRRRKIVFGIGASVFIVLLLLLAAILIAPKLIDSEVVKAKVRSEIKETAGIDLYFKHLVLNFFPHPHVIFNGVTLSVPPAVKGKAVSFGVQPKILPLFLGKMQIAGLHLDSAELDYTFPKKPATAKNTPQPISYYNLAKKIQSVVTTLPEFKIPDLDFRVNNSSANLFVGDQKFLKLTEVDSHLAGPLEGRKIALSCKSNLWQGISVKGLLNARTFKGSGQIQLTQFRPQGLVANLFSDSPLRLTEAPANLTIDFKSDETGELQAEATGSSPYLNFRYGKETLNIKNARLKAAIQVDKNILSLLLAELALDSPQLTLSAKLALTQSSPPLSLEVKGSQIDVAATRQMVLAFAGKNEDVKDVFDIVKGGSVPLITLKAQGNSLSDLGNLDNMVIRGQMRDGEISIPDIQFDLTGAAAEVVISRGIPEGQKLQARLGNSSAQNGHFDLTLLVAPLVTLDRIFEHIPLIGGILEALDTIPLSAKGTLDNIHIYPLAPSAIGYELAEMMKRTVERPINLIHGGKGSEVR